jgi:hypothetical protein
MLDSVPPGVDEGKASAADHSQPVPTAFRDDPIKEQLEHLKRAEQLQFEMARQPPKPAQPQLSQFKLDFLAAHPELVADEEATTLTRYHYLAALRRGIADDTPEMNAAILAGHKRMRGAIEDASHEPEREAPPVNAPMPRRSVPYAAPVSRGVPSASGGAVSTTVTLSPEERDMARRSYQGLPPEAAEKLYSQMKYKMLVQKANGSQ